MNNKALFFIGLAVFAYIHQRQKALKKRAALWGTALFMLGLVAGHFLPL